MKKNMDRKKPLILVAMQTDLRNTTNYDSDMPLTNAEGKDLAKEIGALNYVECSTKDTNSVKKVFTEVVHAAMKYRKRKSSIVHKLLGK